MADEQKKFRVLIVDDDKFLLNMYALKFEKEGVEVQAIESAEELLTKLKEGLTADLLLLDIIIPGMDGLTALEKAKEEKLLNNMKVVMLTNQGDPDEMKKAHALGIDGYIIKAMAIPSEVVDQVMVILKQEKNK